MYFLTCICHLNAVREDSAAQRAQVKLIEDERHKVAMDLKERAARATVVSIVFSTVLRTLVQL